LKSVISRSVLDALRLLLKMKLERIPDTSILVFRYLRI